MNESEDYVFPYYRGDLMRPRTYYPQRPLKNIRLQCCLVYQRIVHWTIGYEKTDALSARISDLLMMTLGVIDYGFILKQVKPQASVCLT